MNYHKYNFSSLANNSIRVYLLCNETAALGNISSTFFEYCQLHNRSGMYGVYFEHYQMIEISAMMEDFLTFVVVPCSCVLSLVLNIHAIRTIKKHEKKDLKEDFYKYMRVNSKFNCLYCLIFLFYQMDLCNERNRSYFCSSISNTLFAQYYKIVILAYLGESIKMCSNIFYILISINRYMLIGREHAPFLEKISKLDFTRTIISTVALSLVFNIGHLDQYEVNNGNAFVQTNFYGEYPLVSKTSYFSIH